MKKLLNYIGGELVEPICKQFIENESPTNGQVFSLIPDSDKEDVDLAVEEAKKAFPSWSGLSKQERHDHMMRLADGIQSRFDEMVAAESLDNGKPEWLAKQVDIPRASENLRFYAQRGRRIFQGLCAHIGATNEHALDGGSAPMAALSPWALCGIQSGP